MSRKAQSNQDYNNSIRVLIVKLPKLKSSFYRIQSLLYAAPDSYLKESKTRTILFFLSSIMCTLQLASILFNPNVAISNWSDYSTIWALFQYTRIDNVCSLAFDAETCSGIIINFSLLAGLSFISLFIYYYYSKKIIRVFFYYLKLFILINELQGVSFIYCSLTNTSESHQSSAFSQSLKPLSFISLAIYIIFGYFHLTFSYEFRHYFAIFNINSRASNKVVWKSKFVLLLTTTILTLLLKVYFEGIIIICLLLNTYLVHILSKSLPFYQLRANYLSMSPHLFVGCGSLVLLISRYIKDAFFSVLGIFLFIPFLFLLAFNRVKINLNNTKPPAIGLVKDVNEFELLYRKDLVRRDGERVKDTIKNLNYIFYKSNCEISKAFILWFTSFCFYNCEYHKIALIKSSLFLKVTPSIEEDFYEFGLREKIFKFAESENWEYKLMRKFRKIEALDELEKKTLAEFINFQNEVTSSSSTLGRIETKMGDFIFTLRKVLEKYSVQVAKFPNSLMILSSFLNLLEIFKVDVEKLKEVQNKVEGVKNTMKSMFNKPDHSIDNNPIVLVSATRQDYGRILFVNRAFESLTQQPPETYLNKLVKCLFPDSLTLFDLNSMKKFKEVVEEDTTYFNEQAYLKVTDETFIEVDLSVTLMSYSKGFFLFYFNKLYVEREVVLISRQGVIEGYTKGIQSILGSDSPIVGRFISEFIPIDFNILTKEKNMEFNLQYPPILIQYNKFKVNQSTLRVIYLYRNKDNKMKAQLELSEIITSKKYRKSVMFTQKNTQSKLIFVPRFVEESIEDMEHDSLIELSQKSIPVKKKVIKLKSFSIRAMKMFHILTVFSVIPTQIIIISALTIFSTVYIQNHINNMVSRQGYEYLSSSIIFTKAIAVYSFILSLNLNESPDLVNFTKSEFLDAIKSLEGIKNEFKELDSNWDFCPEAEKLFEQTIPVYYSKDGLDNPKFATAFEFFSTVVIKSQNFMLGMENGKDLSYEFKFIQANTFGAALNRLEAIKEEMKYCEYESFEHLRLVKIALIVGGVGATVIFGIGLFYLVKNIQVKQYKMWRKMIKRMHMEKVIRNMCSSRLSTLGIKELNIEELKVFKRKKIPKLRFFYRYILTVSILLLFVTIYYLVAYYYFYSEFELKLSSRLEISTSLKDSTSGIVSFNYWELNAYSYPSDIPSLIGGKAFFSTDYIKNLKNEVSLLKTCLSTIKNNLNEILESGTLFDRIFREQDNYSYLRKGTVSGIFAWIFDGYLILAGEMTSDSFLSYLLYMVYIKKELEFDYEYYISESNKKLNSLTDQYINFTSVLLAIFAIFYFCWFKAFLSREKKSNDNFDYLMMILEKDEIDRK